MPFHLREGIEVVKQRFSYHSIYDGIILQKRVRGLSKKELLISGRPKSTVVIAFSVFFFNKRY